MKKTRLIIGLILCCFSFCSCGGEKQNDGEASGVENVKTAANDNAPVKTVEYNIDDLNTAVNAILEQTTADFIGHYPVTESFLYWVAVTYGQNVILDIANTGDYSNSEIWFEKTKNSIHALWYRYCVSCGLDAYDYSHIHNVETANDDVFVLEFCGDVNLADRMATTNYMESRPNGIKDCFSADLMEEMQAADLFVVNNEFAYTERGEALEGKSFTFRSKPERVSMMQEIGTDLVTLANNHVWDYGEIGVLDTLDTLDAAGLPYVGAGRDLTEAMRPQYYIWGGRKIAIVNATQIERSYTYTKQATSDMAGVLKTLNDEIFCSVIKAAKQNSDYVIACVHWGTEGDHFYGADQTNLANDFIASGCDLIIGGHTHCLQGIEYISGVPVFYSLGNYWFSSTESMPASYYTGLAKLSLDQDLNASLSFIPCEFYQGVTSLLNGDDAAYVYTLLEEYSAGTLLDENGNIEKR